MKIMHTVQTDDGSVCLSLGDGDTIAELIARGANGKEVTVHLGYSEVESLLNAAAIVRLGLHNGDRCRVVPNTTHTLGGVTDLDALGGAVTFALASRDAAYTLIVGSGAGTATALTVSDAAHESLIVGLSTMLSQL